MFKMCAAPQREQPNPPKVRRGFTFDVQNAHRATTRATQPAKSPRFDVQNARRATTRATQPAKSPQRVHFRCSKYTHRATTRAAQPAKSPQRVHFRCSKCAPRHNESNPTRQKSAEGSLSIFKMRTAPRRDTTLRSDMGAAPHGDTKS